MLETAAQYLAKAPQRRDVLSAFAGIRPAGPAGDSRITAALSRDHTIHVDPSGLLTITGGKWTTYRHMAEDTVDQAALQAHLPTKVCVTRTLRVHGAIQEADATGPLAIYGSDAAEVAAIMRTEPDLAEPLHADLGVSGAEVVWAARAEMARTVEDVLSRRSRALLLNARAAIAMAPRVAALLARELRRDDAWQRDRSGSLHAARAGLSRRSLIPGGIRDPDPARILAYFASGSGRIWKRITLLVVPFPVSMWNGARVLTVEYRPRPFHPAFASSIRPSNHFV